LCPLDSHTKNHCAAQIDISNRGNSIIKIFVPHLVEKDGEDEEDTEGVDFYELYQEANYKVTVIVTTLNIIIGS
jgi:hypothetical protein